MENNYSIKKSDSIGIIGSGAMGSGIAQVAATAGHKVVLYDFNPEAIDRAKNNLQSTLKMLVEKQKITSERSQEIFSNLSYTTEIEKVAGCKLIIEAIVERLDVKKTLFENLDTIVSKDCILASNTSSLSITSIAAACKHNERVVGIHFFNPAPLMPLVEVIPGIATASVIPDVCKELLKSWGKMPVICKDTPGFIVNRIARPYYGEAIRLLEEGYAEIHEIDWALKTKGGFKMGPFELTDLIGHDVNYVVTETVWKEFYFDPRFKPSIIQKRLVEAGFYGKKSGRGFYNYQTPREHKTELADDKAQYIFDRVIAMLINEAFDALNLKVASREDIDLAMTKGVNYPKGLLAWADEIGLRKIYAILHTLYVDYGEDRYRPNILLKKMAGA